MGVFLFVTGRVWVLGVFLSLKKISLFFRSPKQSSNQVQIAPVTSALSGAIIKKEQSVELTPSLSNYYNEKLVGHVLGWQADHVEKQV